MRKLRKAALVAAMIGSLSMAGAGAASADSKADTGGGSTQCTQEATASNSASLVNIPDVIIAVFGNVSQTNVIQQICSNGEASINENSNVNVNQSNDFLNNLLGGL